MDKATNGQSDIEAGFLRVLPFPFPRTPPIVTLFIIRGWYNKRVVTSVKVDSVPLRPKNEKEKLLVIVTGYSYLITAERV
jgi:hypothetical protein